MAQNNNVIFKTSTTKTINNLLYLNNGEYIPNTTEYNGYNGVAITPGTIYFTSDGHIVYDLNDTTRLYMGQNVENAVHASTVKQVNKNDNKNYKLLFTDSDNPITGKDTEVAYDTDVKINPAENTIIADQFTGKIINNLLIGTGTTGKDNGSGSSNRYQPAKWIFDTNHIATNGNIYIIKLPVAGHDYGVWMSVDNGTNYYPVVRNGTAKLTTHYANGQIIILVFDANGSTSDMFPLDGGTARSTVTGGAFRIINQYDSGNTISQIRHENGRFYVGSTGMNPYSLMCLDKDNKFSMLLANSTGAGTGTSKTINTSGKYRLPAIIYYYNANNTTNANSIATSTYQTYSAYPTIDTRYSHNHTTTFTTNSPLYIECTIDNDGYWSPTAKCITQTLTANNYYIYLGQTYSTEYQLTLTPYHPCYYYDGTNLIDYTKHFINNYGRGIKNITRSGTTFTVTRDDNTTFTFDQDNYSHPTTTAVAAAAIKVGKDSTGHVVIGSALTKSDVGLSNVENTKLSTWTGTNNITTLGTITTGTWNGNTIDIAHGGTNATSTVGAWSNIVAPGGIITGNLQVNGNTSFTNETSIDSATINSLIVNGNTNFVQSPVAPTPTSGDSSTKLATTAFVSNAINQGFAINDAMVFKGVIGSNQIITSLPTQGYNAGWTYRVADAGTYAGEYCEVGDLIIAIKDGPTTGSSVINIDWAKIEHNIDGAVFRGAGASNSSVGSDTQPIYVNSSGIITPTTYSLAKSVPSNAEFTDNKVTQNSSSAYGWRKILLNGDVNNYSSSDWQNDITAQTSEVYQSKYLSANPSNGSLSAKRYYVRGSANSNNYIYSESTNQIYLYINGVVSLTATDAEIRRGSNANFVNLGSSTYPWNNLYVKDFFTKEATESGTTYRTLIIGNETNRTGRISLYSGSKGGYIQQTTNNTNNWYLHQLPARTGWLVTAGNGISTGAGSSTIPIYVDTNGIAQPITSYNGNAATATRLNNIVLTQPNDNNNALGYRLILQDKIRSSYYNKRVSFAVSSRHSGNGIITISYGCNSSSLTKQNCYVQIRYFGNINSGTIIKSDSYQAYLTDDCKIYFFWKYIDSNIGHIIPLTQDAIPLVSRYPADTSQPEEIPTQDFISNEGAWVSSIDTSIYGSKVAITSINIADNCLPLTGGTMTNTATNNAQINFSTYSGANSTLSIYGATNDKKAGITFSGYNNKRNLTISHDTILIDNRTETSGWAGYLGVKKDASNNYVGLGWYGESSVLKYFYMGGTYNSPYLRMLYDTDSTDGYFAFSRNIQPYSGTSVSLGTTTYKWSDLYVKDFFTKEATESGTTYRTLMIGNETNRTGRISLYSGSKGGYIQQAANNTNNWVLHQLPVESGWIVKAGNGTSTGAGDKETPIYVDTRGVAKPINALPVNQNLLMNTQYYFNNNTSTKPIKIISTQDIPIADCYSKYGRASGVGTTDLNLGTFAPEPDTWYTLSFYAKTNYNNTSIRTHFYPDTTATSYNCQGFSSTAGDGVSIFTVSTKWQRYWVCYKTSASVSGTKNLIARLTSGISPGTTLRVALPKLEVGQVMTSWIPHSEDFSQNKISTCYVDNHDVNNYQWHRIATCSVTVDYPDKDIILFVHKGYLANAFGILKISIRVENNEASLQAKWLLRHGFSESDCFIGLTRTSVDTSSTAIADIYFKTSSTKARIAFTALNNFNKGFTLLNSDEISKTENNVKVTDLANSTEVYIKEDNMNGDTIESIKLKGDASSNTGTTYVSWAYASDSSSEKSLIPNANITYNLGSSSLKWANVYANNYYGNWVGETIPVNKGGTGQTSFTTNYVLVGNGTNGIKASSKLQIPVNDTGMITAVLPMNLSGGGTSISATDNSTGNLIIGSRTADHLALDANEIQGRTYSNEICTANTLYLNYRGGEVWLGLNGAIRTGIVALYPKNDLSLTLGKNAARWSNIYTKGNINIGLAGDEATIQYDSTNKTLNFIFN